ncbi:unnamed protein product [Lymnaea stagnalis]|uniref:Protein sleepless n=1 Tax=Lymnaea stagnalis TaxID=6523 RepID=A0AAV2I1U1_LYMST
MWMTNSVKNGPTQLWLFVIVILCALDGCGGIYCFVCNSINNDACGDDFRISTSDSKLRMQCDGGSCIKRRATRVEGSVRRVEIIRSCYNRLSESCFDEYFNNVKQYTCACNYDFCNASVKPNPQSLTVILFALLIAILFPKTHHLPSL